MSEQKKFENPDVEKQVLELLASNGFSASCGWIAKKLDICWVTAKMLLLDMARQGKLKMTRTSIGYVFSLPDSQVQPTPTEVEE